MSRINLRPETGFSVEDTYNIKVFMRSYNDALGVSQEVAEKDSSVDHYKSYIKLLINS